MPRKKPFSNKQKKKQLQEKRQKKREHSQNEDTIEETRLHAPELSLDDGSNISADVSEEDRDSLSLDADDEETSTPDITKLNFQPFKLGMEKKFDPNRYRLHFERETKAEIEARKKKAREPLQIISETNLEVTLERIYHPGSVLDIPKRPPWNYKMSKEAVETNERKMFTKYLENIYKEHKTSELSYFEHNLETWRQLWRVLEVSDIVVIIADIRHPVLHFPSAIYHYVVKELRKDIILVLNKIDLVSAEVVVAWKYYFLSKFENLNVVCFTSFPKDENERKGEQKKILSQRRRKKKGFFAVGPKDLLSACKKISGERVDLSSWEKRIIDQEKGEDDGVVYEEYGFSEESEEEDEKEFEDVEQNESILTLGLVGHPNVGKSSLLNGLVGKKVVSTSRTPGHTKHFQTIFLTSSVRLCDSPGLVFPSLVDKQLQILSGMYPIAQVQEPYTAVGYLASRVSPSLVDLLELVHPGCNTDTECEEEHDHSTQSWSAWDICDAWAEKRGYYTAKTGRPDTYRAANNILRLAVDGRIVLCVYPPGFINEKEKWLKHSDTASIAELQEKQTLSRRLRSSECNDGNTEEEFVSHLMTPKHKRKTRDPKGRKMSADVASSEGDDEAEESEAVVTINPYSILSDD